MTTRFQYCSSLKTRAIWSSLVPDLIRSRSPRWKEAKFDTHDVQLPIAKPADAPERTLCAIFLGPDDVGLDETESRLERLYHFNGGRDAIIIFLLEPNESGESPMEALAKLQMSMIGSREIHVVPINSTQMTMRSIFDYQRLLSVAGRPQRSLNPAQTLLPYCCQGPRLPEHTVNVVTDVTTSVRDVLDHISNDEGRALLTQYIGADADHLWSFWIDEYLAE